MNLMINYSSKWWYKLITWFLILSLVIMISFGVAPKVHAVGVLTMTVCAAIIAVMAGAGIGIVVSGMTSSDIQSWLQGKLQAWDTARNDGNVFTDMINGNLITMTVKGALAIGNAAARGISDFITWLKSDLSLTDNSTQDVYSGTGNFIPVKVYNGTTINAKYISDNDGILATNYNGRNGYIVYNGILGPVAAAFIETGTVYRNLILVSNVDLGQFKCSFIEKQTYDLNITLANHNWHYQDGAYYSGISTITSVNATLYLPVYNNLSELMAEFTNNGITQSFNLSLDTDVINIPDVNQDTDTDIVIGIDGVYPGATTDEATDVIMDGVTTNTLDTTMTVTSEYVDAIEAVIINEQPIQVNTDHHMIGFTNLPDFQGLNLNSIWHYVSDAVDYASGWISWFISMLSSIPALAIPLYMSFTLLIVLSFIRRILL